MENLSIYNQLKSVPKEYLKTIAAGRLKGMSDIKPQWRVQKLTEVFGPCGIGWKIQNVSYEYVTKGEETVCNCRLELCFKYENEWSDPIPGTGGSKFSTVESKGVYVSDEAEKMAMTDAISVASKLIGVAGDVYMGHGGKYDPQPNNKNIPPNRNANGNIQGPEKWLNVDSEEWKALVKSISGGATFTLTQIKKKYKVSEETAKELESLNVF